MTTDWLIVRRLCAELERELRGGRVTDAGLLDDGRFALAISVRGRKRVLAIAPFATPPSLELLEAELALGVEPGYARAAAVSLRGMNVISVRGRRGDRLAAIEVGTRSRFGVGNTFRVVAELVPRFGNVLVLRDRTIVAAAKTFSLADNPARPIEIGGAYEPPPLPEPRTDGAGFVALVAAGGDDRAALTKALGAANPLVPRLVAESIVAATLRVPWSDSAALARELERAAHRIEAATAGEPDGLGDVFVYRRDGALVAAHVVPLHQYDDLAHARAPALLPLVAEAIAASTQTRAGDALERRRRTMLRMLERRLAALRTQLAALERERDDAAGRDALRAEGEAIYASLHERPEDEREAEKERAFDLFARYRKATDALPHLERREGELRAAIAAVDELLWEAERADPPALADVEAELDALSGTARGKRASPAPGKRRVPLAFTLDSGARILVGRSPRENADLTFRVARADDLWFHARNIPGSHVILQQPDRREPREDDIVVAAGLAALHSKARASDAVDVDYTARKFVRKQRNAPAGLVWYTDFKTVRVAPTPVR